MNNSFNATPNMTLPEHELGELDRLGGHYTLTGVLKLVLQHGVDNRETDASKAEEYMNRMLGFGAERAGQVQAAIDQVEDTSDAIREVMLHGLHVNRQFGHHGEAYLRMYGVLNAAYIITRASKTLLNSFLSHKEKELYDRMRSEPLYELRNRIGAHPMDFGSNKDVYHRLIQMDMFRDDGKRSFVSSDKGYQEVDIINDIRNFELTSLSVLLELTECAARRVIKRKSDHYAWLNERLEFVIGKVGTS